MSDLRSGHCALCDHDEVVETEPIELHGDWGERSRPLVAAYARRENGDVDTDGGCGRLRLYVCRGCGAAQWFVDMPGTIPIGNEYGTRLVTKEKRPPYR